MIWNKEMECADRETMRALQLEKLQKTVKHGYENVPHYKEAFDKAGVKPEDIKTLEDITKLPFITKEDIAANYPTGLFAVPKKETWLNWQCSCHHWELEPMIDPFLNGKGLMLLAVWGHAYEFDQRDDWEVITDQLARLGNHEDVWYATNIQVFDYITAFNELDVAVDGSSAYNRSCMNVWVSIRGKKYEIPAGQAVRF
mgnify:CR=1 FL=1